MNHANECYRWARVTTKYEYDKGILDCGCGNPKDSKVYYRHDSNFYSTITGRYTIPYCGCSPSLVYPGTTTNFCEECMYKHYDEMPKYDNPHDLVEPLEVISRQRASDNDRNNKD